MSYYLAGKSGISEIEGMDKMQSPTDHDSEAAKQTEARQKPAHKQQLKQFLHDKRTRILGGLMIVLIAAGAGAFALTHQPEPANVVTLPDGSKKTLSLEETGYTGVAADVPTNLNLFESRDGGLTWNLASGNQGAE